MKAKELAELLLLTPELDVCFPEYHEYAAETAYHEIIGAKVIYNDNLCGVYFSTEDFYRTREHLLLLKDPKKF